MKIAVIGAGLSGLNAARILSEYADVVVFEKNSVGGLLSSVCEDYCIEKFYHHCFRGDEYLIELINDLGLSSKLVWKVVRVGQELNGKIYPLNTPLEILRYPGMSLIEKVKLAKFTVTSRNRDYRNYDDVGVVDGIKKELGESLLDKFFLPLLKSKFGENYQEVSYAWLLARVSIRSNRKLTGEELGYLKGGFQALIDRLSEGLAIKFESAKINKSGRWEVNGEKFDALVFTGPLPELGDLRRKLGIESVKYQSSICCILTSESPITEDIYWTNFHDAPFGAMIEHTNFMPVEDYGEYITYLASYTTPDKLYEKSDEELKKLCVSYLKRLGFDEKDLRKFLVFRAKFSGPIYERGYLRKITPYKVAEGFYVAGMTSEANYPERSMNGSLLAGKRVAEKIIRDLLS